MRVFGGLGWTSALRIAGVVAVVTLALFIPASGLAVHELGVFELDGNAVSANAPLPVGPADDWDRVCHQKLASDCSTSSNTTGSTAVEWASDGALNATIFTGGGSKDGHDISDWAWKDGAGGLPDKDNLLHSFAARYTATSADCGALLTTCEVLYFGSDRFDNSGDAQQGFWFFQNPVGLGSNAVGGGTGFTGTHALGDLLIISDFSNGGTTSTITVYKWNSAVSGNLELLETSTTAGCPTAAPNDAFCGIVNSSDGTVAPWPFLDKSGFSSYLQGEFYEGGINLSLLGLGHECFSSVASETRSSTST